MDKGIKIENDLKQLLIGSLLGDGCFCSVGNQAKNKCLSIAHSEKQEDYLRFKHSILAKYNLASPIVKYRIVNSRYKSGECKGSRFKSRLHPIFTDIRTRCYDSTGHKRVIKDFISDIDALGLAIWYMDDGFVTKNSCIFSTCSFTFEEQTILSELLLDKFGLHFTIGKHDNSMYLHAEDFPKFKELISPYVLESMQYKLIPYSKRVLDKQGELLEQPDRSISSQAQEVL